MARYGNFAYPPGMTDSEHGKRLYQCWRSMRKKKDHAEEFDDYAKFYEWSMQAGYAIGCRLCRKDQTKPYSPDNCEWRPMKDAHPSHGEENREWCVKWNKTVNRIRVACGMEPFPEEMEENNGQG